MKASLQYPRYYHDVWITFIDPIEDCIKSAQAWLAINDKLEPIWTLSDSDVIIPDEWVDSWEER